MGLFITFEGPDGTGKSTNALLLEQYLVKNGKQCIRTREPGGTDIGEKIREILLSTKNTGMADETEALLYAAARQEIVLRVILPALESGKIVICDRFYDSSIAYQGYGRGLGEDYIKNINSAAINICKPDITFLLWTDKQSVSSRVSARGEKDRLEAEKEEFFERVREGFMELYKKEQDRIVLIDTSKPIEAVFEQIVAIVNEKLKAKGL